MELIKLGLPKEENIVSRNKFIINHIFPIGFKPANRAGTMFIILFVATQDMDESCIYLQSMICANTKLEMDYFKNHNLNIVNMKEGTKISDDYKNLIKDLNKSNLYCTDFLLNNEKDYPLYYHSTATRVIDQSHASVLDIYLNRDYFIKINLYLNRLNNIGLFPAPELIFSDSKLNNMEFVSIEKIKHDATARNGTVNLNHYTMWCGPSVYKMNYLSIIDKDHISVPLSNPLDIHLYDAFYSTHTIVDEFVVFDDQLFILYEEKNEITNEFDSMKVLKLSKDLADKTNFLDYNNMIYNR